jgi:hypothetical protein
MKLYMTYMKSARGKKIQLTAARIAEVLMADVYQ